VENGHAIWNFEFQGFPQASFFESFVRELEKKIISFRESKPTVLASYK
jgi:hypothetical protein